MRCSIGEVTRCTVLLGSLWIGHCAWPNDPTLAHHGALPSVETRLPADAPGGQRPGERPVVGIECRAMARGTEPVLVVTPIQPASRPISPGTACHPGATCWITRLPRGLGRGDRRNSCRPPTFRVRRRQGCVRVRRTAYSRSGQQHRALVDAECQCSAATARWSAPLARSAADSSPARNGIRPQIAISQLIAVPDAGPSPGRSDSYSASVCSNRDEGSGGAASGAPAHGAVSVAR